MSGDEDGQDTVSGAHHVFAGTVGLVSGFINGPVMAHADRPVIAAVVFFTWAVPAAFCAMSIVGSQGAMNVVKTHFKAAAAGAVVGLAVFANHAKAEEMVAIPLNEPVAITVEP